MWWRGMVLALCCAVLAHAESSTFATSMTVNGSVATSSYTVSPGTAFSIDVYFPDTTIVDPERLISAGDNAALTPRTGSFTITSITDAGEPLSGQRHYYINVTPSLTPGTTSTLTIPAGLVHDNASNGNAAATITFITDTTPSKATLTASSVSTATTYARAGQTVTITVTFATSLAYLRNNAAPTLDLNLGGRSATLSAPTGDGPMTAMTFTYTVQAGDNTARLETASSESLHLNGATIDGSTVAYLPTPGAGGSLTMTSKAVIDTAVPTVRGLSTASVPESGSATITATLSEAIAAVDLTAASFSFDTSGWRLGTPTLGSDRTTISIPVVVSSSVAHGTSARLTIPGNLLVDAAGNAGSDAVFTLTYDAGSVPGKPTAGATVSPAPGTTGSSCGSGSLSALTLAAGLALLRRHRRIRP